MVLEVPLNLIKPDDRSMITVHTNITTICRSRISWGNISNFPLLCILATMGQSMIINDSNRCDKFRILIVFIVLLFAIAQSYNRVSINYHIKLAAWPIYMKMFPKCRTKLCNYVNVQRFSLNYFG